MNTTHDPAEVRNFLREAIQDLVDVDPEVLTDDAVLEDIGLMSLDYVEIHVLSKKQYGVELSFEMFVSGQIKTLGQLADYIACYRPAHEVSLSVAGS